MLQSDMPPGLLEAAQQGVDWVLAQQRPDGSFSDAAGGTQAYYKA